MVGTGQDAHYDDDYGWFYDSSGNLFCYQKKRLRLELKCKNAVRLNRNANGLIASCPVKRVLEKTQIHYRVQELRATMKIRTKNGKRHASR